MNVATQIVGERLAKEVEAQAIAVETLSQPQRSFTSWQYVGWLVLGGAWGFFISKSVHVGTELIGATAGAAFFLAAAAFKECITLRRKLEAVIVLWRQNQAQ